MSIEVEVMEGGMLRLTSPELPVGSKFTIPSGKGIRPPLIGDGSWESLKEALDEAKKLDIPRRTHEEILRDLHEFREST